MCVVSCRHFRVQYDSCLSLGVKSPFPSVANCTVIILPNKLYINFTLHMVLELGEYVRHIICVHLPIDFFVVIVLLTVWRAVAQRQCHVSLIIQRTCRWAFRFRTGKERFRSGLLTVLYRDGKQLSSFIRCVANLSLSSRHFILYIFIWWVSFSRCCK